jgi:hypothetical protein
MAHPLRFGLKLSQNTSGPDAESRATIAVIQLD